MPSSTSNTWSPPTKAASSTDHETVFYQKCIYQYKVSSVQGVEHVEEKNPEEPHRDEDVVDSQCDVLVVFLDLCDDRHAVYYQHADKRHPCQNGMINAIVQEIHTQESCITSKIPAIP